MDKGVSCIFPRLARPARRTTQKLLLNFFVRTGVDKFIGHANAVEDGSIVGGSVANDTDSPYSQQLSPAIFAIVQASAEVVECLP